MTDLLKALPFAAKAVAAFVTPFIVVALAWVADNVTPFDVPTPGAIETAVVAVLNGLVVYFTRNTPKES